MSNKAPKSISEPRWDALSPKQFEEFTFHLVNCIGFQQAETVSGSGDEGQDITAYEPPAHPGIDPITRRWVFQCKRVQKLSKHEILSELANFETKSLDTWLLVTTANPSVALRKWFKELGESAKYSYYLRAFWRFDLTEHARKYGALLLRVLPPIITDLLKLKAFLKYTEPSVLAAVFARCRNSVTTSISRYARNKYIPGLYVRRHLQTELAAFHAREPILAQHFKEHLVNVLAPHEMLLTELNMALDNVDNGNTSHINTYSYLPATVTTLRTLSTFNLDLSAILQRIRCLSDTCLYAESMKRVGLITMVQNIIDNLTKLVNTDLDKELAKTKDLLSDELRAESCTGTGTTSSLIRRVSNVANKLPSEYLVRLVAALIDVKEAIQQCLRPSVIVIDRAGGGKTNLLCHVASEVALQSPTILLFGKQNFVETDSVIRAVLEIVDVGSNGDIDMLASTLDLALEREGMFLNVFIDGINESRDIPGTEGALLSFLDWAGRHRIRVSITCRDIYWHFFEFDRWREFAYKVWQNELYEFSVDEYRFALPLYFEHYRIRCELSESAEAACQHPLLLRFFCGAYGSPGGPIVKLGSVRDIRLKELFDRYFEKKVDQIRQSLRHHSDGEIVRFIMSVADTMYKANSPILPTTDLQDAIGYRDWNSEHSVYVRLLDEDIILEEQPGDQLQVRRVQFVYEEFLEYVLARSFLLRWPNTKRQVPIVFETVGNDGKERTNLRGMLEYVAVSLLQSKDAIDKRDGLAFLDAMLDRGPAWIDAFWSVIGKLPDKAVNFPLFDLLHKALSNTKVATAIRNCLHCVSKLSQRGAARLAGAVMWSGMVPNVFRWIDVERLGKMTGGELEECANRLQAALRQGHRFESVINFGYARLLEIVLPHFDDRQGRKFRDRLKLRGKPGKSDVIHAMHIVRDLFPEYQTYLLNGPFHIDEDVAHFCCDRLRFVEENRKEVALLCRRLGEVNPSGSQSRILRTSAGYLSSKI